MLSLTNQVGDHPVLLAELKIFQSESYQFSASQAASNEQGKNRPITFASEVIFLRFCEYCSGLFDAQREHEVLKQLDPSLANDLAKLLDTSAHS